MDTNYQIAGKDQSSNVHGRHQTVLKKRKRIGDPNTDCENMQSGHRDGIPHRKIRLANNETLETTQDGKNRPIKPRRKLEHSEKRKPINTWEYWKPTPSNK